MKKNLIIIDDDIIFRDRLKLSMEKKGFLVEVFSEVKKAEERLKEKNFNYAIVDMRLDSGSGLDIIQLIKKDSPETISLLLTGYGNIATAVAAIKSGAVDYLPKPAEVDQIYEALTTSEKILPLPPKNPMTADRVRWEHIQRVFIQCNRNVSETARRLRMHRRTLQRILNKHAPRE
jgi:two-component system response regulator RegA